MTPASHAAQDVLFVSAEPPRCSHVQLEPGAVLLEGFAAAEAPFETHAEYSAFDLIRISERNSAWAAASGGEDSSITSTVATGRPS